MRPPRPDSGELSREVFERARQIAAEAPPLTPGQQTALRALLANAGHGARSDAPHHQAGSNAAA